MGCSLVIYLVENSLEQRVRCQIWQRNRSPFDSGLEFPISQVDLIVFASEDGCKNRGKAYFKTSGTWGSWVAQLVKHPAFDFLSGHDFTAMGSSPMSGSVLTAQAWGLLGILCLSVSLCPFSLSFSLSLSLSLSLSDKQKN